VSPEAQVGDGTQIWHQCQIREDAKIGKQCIFGKNVYVDFGVRIGDKVKVQNNSSIFHGTVIEDGVFIGPHVILTNDKHPRAVNPDFSLKGNDDWEEAGVTIRRGASLGAGAIVCPGVTIGKFAMVGAGSVVTKNVPDQAVVVGNPARVVGYVCRCGKKLETEEEINNRTCKRCGEEES
jgi:acetyltransferase-like isoleucine patch superfamily enzyme